MVLPGLLVRGGDLPGRKCWSALPVTVCMRVLLCAADCLRLGCLSKRGTVDLQSNWKHGVRLVNYDRSCGGLRAIKKWWVCAAAAAALPGP